MYVGSIRFMRRACDVCGVCREYAVRVVYVWCTWCMCGVHGVCNVSGVYVVYVGYMWCMRGVCGVCEV